MKTVSMYKVLSVFELDGVQKTIGEEIFLSERDATTYLKQGFITHGRVLDPDNKDDADKIAEVEAAEEARYAAGKQREEEREEQHQADLGAEDDKRAELVAEATEILTAIAAEDGKDPDRSEISKISSLPTADLEKRVEELRSQKPAAEVSEDMKRDELEEIARAEGLSDEKIEEAGTKADLVIAIEENRKSK